MIEYPLHPPLTETTASMTPEEITEVFQTLFDLYGVLNSEGKIIELRGPVFKETQTDTALLSGQIFSETVFWQSTENTAITLANSVAAAIRGEGSTMTIAFRQSANSKIPLELSLVPVCTEEHRKVIVCGRQQAEATSSEGFERVTEQLLSAAESAEIGIWYWDFNSGQISSTPRCNELLGLPAYEKLTYERIKQAIHPDDREFVIAFLDESRRNGTRYA
jgi:PAS domain-containing protein